MKKRRFSPFVYLLFSLSVYFFLYGLLENVIFFTRWTVSHFKQNNAFISTTRPDAFGGITFRPFIEHKLYKNSSNLSTDGYGFIHNGDRDRIIRKKSIYIFGGSTLEGRGATHESKTISAQLEKCLENKKGYSPQVINVGFAGDYSNQKQARLFGRILKNFDPEAIIFLGGFNDGFYTTRKYYYPLNANAGIWDVRERSAFKDFNYKLYPNTISIFKQSFEKIKLKKYQDSKNEEKSYQDFLDFKNENIKIFVSKKSIEKNLEKRSQAAYENYKYISDTTNKFLEKENIYFLNVLQPTLSFGTKSRTIKEKKHLNDFLNNGDLGGTGKDYFKYINTFYTKVKTLNSKYFLDISNLFDNEKETLYVDSVHYNDKANKLIADRLCQKLKKESFYLKNLIQ